MQKLPISRQSMPMTPTPAPLNSSSSAVNLRFICYEKKNIKNNDILEILYIKLKGASPANNIRYVYI